MEKAVAGDIVIKLHDLARQLETDKRMYVFSKDLRDLSDRFSRVCKNHYFAEYTQEEIMIMNYVGVNTKELVERD